MPSTDLNLELPLNALSYAFKEVPALLPEPSHSALIIHPRPHRVWSEIHAARRCFLTPYKGEFEWCHEQGWSAEIPSDASFDRIIIVPGISKDETLALFGLAASKLTPQGVVIASLENGAGASRFEKKLAELLGSVEYRSKFHCRVFWGSGGEINTSLMEEWRALGDPRPLAGTTFTVQPGIFSAEHLDPGSTLLTTHLPESLPGRGADLGCGYGYLTHHVLTHCSGITQIDCFDNDRRAVQLAERNLASLQKIAPISLIWHDLNRPLPKAGMYDWVIMNPPFHLHGSQQVEIGKRFFLSASHVLRSSGTLYAVVNRHLPYSSIIERAFTSHEILAKDREYVVIRAVR